MDVWAYAVGTANIATAPVYAYVGWRLLQRPVPTAARLPAAQFSIWWIGLGVVGLISGVEGLAAGLGVLGFPTAFTAYLLTVLVDTGILWGLVGYLVYIYTGKYHLLALSVFYAAFYIAVLDYVVSSEPYGVVVTAGVPSLVDHLVPTNGPLVAFVVFGLVVPELAGATLYLSLIRKTTDRTRRYRIAMVSGSVWLYFGLALIGSPRSMPAAELWNVLRALLDVVSAIVALVAFYPPGLLQRWLRVDAVPGGPAPGPGVEG